VLVDTGWPFEKWAEIFHRKLGSRWMYSWVVWGKRFKKKKGFKKQVDGDSMGFNDI
jgi:hypothetical protein